MSTPKKEDSNAMAKFEDNFSWLDKEKTLLRLQAEAVMCLRKRYQRKNLDPLSLYQILVEINEPHIESEKQLLLKESLENNPKVQITPNKKYLFKPPYKVHDEASLLRLLKFQDIKGLGGVLVEDLQESLPTADIVVQKLVRAGEAIVFDRPEDKKHVVFFNDKLEVQVNDKFKSMWHFARVDHLSDHAVEQYLMKNGIKPLQVGEQVKMPVIEKRKKQQIIRNKKKFKSNVHISGMLETYENEREQ